MFDAITLPFGAKMLFNTVKLNPGVTFDEVEVAVGEMCNVVKETYGGDKGGFIAGAQRGDPTASSPTPQPGSMRPMVGAYGRATGATSLAFVSQLSLDRGALDPYGLTKSTSAVRGCRTVTKRDMKLNDALPKMHVDAESYVVIADGEELRSKPAAVLPLAQRYFLF